MIPNLKRLAVALLFASVAITCSLTMWATTPGHDAAADTDKISASRRTIHPQRRQWAGWQFLSVCWGHQGFHT